MALAMALMATMLAAGTPTKAVSNLASYVRNDDYPDEAIRKGEQGFVGFLLDVSPEGAVIRCTVVQTSGSAVLDATTCQIMSERARFSPARDARGRAVVDSVRGGIRWVLPSASTGQDLRAINNIWEVTGGGRQLSCRMEFEMESGELMNLPGCRSLDLEFVRAAAGYLKVSPEEVLTIRLENRWTLDPVLPFVPSPEKRGLVLARAEGDYRLNEDLSVRDCVEGRFSARIDWRTAPCFRESFAKNVPAQTRNLRMEVQWVVSRGTDMERPSALPSLMTREGKLLLPDNDRQGTGTSQQGGANLFEGPHQP